MIDNRQRRSFEKQFIDDIFYEKEEENEHKRDKELRNPSHDTRQIEIQNEGSAFPDQNGSKDNSHEQLSSKGEKKDYVSPYHNIQKHMVTTIIQTVCIKRDPDCSLVEAAAADMWKIFVNSKNRSKNILFILYGQAKFNQKGVSKFQKYGFQKIVDSYCESTVNQAQNFLRQITIQQMSEEAILQNLRFRRVKNVQILLEYIRNFLKQLEEGQVKLRINDKTSKKIENSIDTQIGTNGPLLQVEKR